jgi:hypothetical protein
MLPDDLRRLASERAHQSGISIGALIRKALTYELKHEHSKEDAFLGDDRMIENKELRKVAEHHDDYLYGGND